MSLLRDIAREQEIHILYELLTHGDSKAAVVLSYEVMPHRVCLVVSDVQDLLGVSIQRPCQFLGVGGRKGPVKYARDFNLPRYDRDK